MFTALFYCVLIMFMCWKSPKGELFELHSCLIVFRENCVWSFRRIFDRIKFEDFDAIIIYMCLNDFDVLETS